MSEKLSPLNDVSSVIFCFSGLGLNKENAHVECIHSTGNLVECIHSMGEL